jgi:carbonic anhydrase
MNDVIGRVVDFEKRVFPSRNDLYAKLVADGQSPKALMISCADSRIVPEQIMQAEPGDLFVCRNAGNIVPPFSTQNGGVSSTVEYAVAALGVRDIIVCGHSGCGAMTALMKPEMLHGMPNVAAWLRHSHAAEHVVRTGYLDLSEAEMVHAATLENVVVQISHLRTHPSVAAGVARGEISLHGWFIDIHTGVVLALDGATGQFVQINSEDPLPIALAAGQRLAMNQKKPAEAA